MFELDAALNRLPRDVKSAHLIGLGGVAMCALAGLLKDSGLAVTGSDNALYPPASDILKAMGITPALGYGPETLPEGCDLVVVGNVVTRRFPVLEAVKARRLPYLSLPQTLGQLFLNRTKNVVVAGCHGKTTTTALTSFLFHRGGLEPGFLIGGATLDFPHAWRVARGGWFIIEGDEYDSAFFNKVPKFLHYRPHTVILTSVEFDHADIYPDLAAVVRAFEALMGIIPPEGRLIACGDSPLVRQVAAACRAPVEFYGLGEGCGWRAVDIAPRAFGSDFTLLGPGGLNARLSLPRPGVYNVLNAVAASAAFLGAGGDAGALPGALAAFRGAKRRQEVLGTFGGVTLVDDFAHHPTAVAATLAALRAGHPGRLLAAFEPRSNTSRRAVFQKDYARALAGADRVFLRLPPNPEKAPEGNRLDGRRLAADLGDKCELFADGLALGRALAAEARPGDMAVIMSNGGFDGLAAYLKDHLGEHAGTAEI